MIGQPLDLKLHLAMEFFYDEPDESQENYLLSFRERRGMPELTDCSFEELNDMLTDDEDTYNAFATYLIENASLDMKEYINAKLKPLIYEDVTESETIIVKIDSSEKFKNFNDVGVYQIFIKVKKASYVECERFLDCYEQDTGLGYLDTDQLQEDLEAQPWFEGYANQEYDKEVQI